MKILRRYFGPLVVLLIAGVVFAWGALTIVIGPNSVIVKVPDKNLAVEILPIGANCPAYRASVYNHSNNTIALLDWGTITEPGSSSFLFCLENIGTSPSVTFAQGTVTPSPSPGAVTITPTGSVAIAAQSVTPTPVTLTVTTGVPATTVGIQYSFSLTIG